MSLIWDCIGSEILLVWSKKEWRSQSNIIQNRSWDKMIVTLHQCPSWAKSQNLHSTVYTTQKPSKTEEEKNIPGTHSTSPKLPPWDSNRKIQPFNIIRARGTEGTVEVTALVCDFFAGVFYIKVYPPNHAQVASSKTHQTGSSLPHKNTEATRLK